jgi:putative ATPase
VDGQRTILFIDEIHRFNKAQQDAFLPHVEKGTIILIGATTENPSFEVISPLLSRCRVFILKALSQADIEAVLRKALEDDDRGYGKRDIEVADEVLSYLAHLSYGDARTALNALEMAVESFGDESDRIILTRDIIEDSMQKRNPLYDKDGEQHFNIISALHKSLRGGDPDASIYWLARMLEGGEEPLYIARRLVRFASEDIGNADPDALSIALNAARTVEFIGLPECKLALAQVVVYLAVSPKSNATYTAYSEAVKDIKRYGALPVPLWLRNAPTALMKEKGYGRGYLYPHDDPEGVVTQEYFPERLVGKQYYKPAKRGFEREIIKRIEYWRGLREGRKPEK